MEIVGFILFILGAAGMDSNGKWFYVAAFITILGVLLMYIGEAFKDYVIWKRKTTGEELLALRDLINKLEEED